MTEIRIDSCVRDWDWDCFNLLNVDLGLLSGKYFVFVNIGQ